MERFLCILMLCFAVAVPAAALEGRAEFVDGDTLRLGGETIRLHGIDALETRQRCAGDGGPEWACGARVTREVQALFDGKSLRCTALDRDRYNRVIAKCYHGGRDIAEILVDQGLAYAFRRFSNDYIAAEKAAAVAGRGVWAWRVETPWEHRAAARAALEAAAPQAAPSSGCRLKGNISSSGRIYHSPGQVDYDRTRIDISRGERWFCTEADARAAGWRAARR